MKRNKNKQKLIKIKKKKTDFLGGVRSRCFLYIYIDIKKKSWIFYIFHNSILAINPALFLMKIEWRSVFGLVFSLFFLKKKILDVLGSS